MSISYKKVLSDFPQFRLLVAALVTSLVGDWIGLLAIFSILGESQDAIATKFSILIVVKQLPIVLFSVFGGILADSYSKKTIMIVSDSARAMIMIGFLVFQSHPPVVYALVFLQSCFSSLFDPSRASIMPGLVSREALPAANGIMSFIWSTSLILGSSVGGFLLMFIGVKGVLILDGLSYLASALIISRIKETSVSQVKEARIPFAEIYRGKSELLVTSLIKPIYGLGAAMYLLLAIIGKENFSTMAHPDVGISILYAARGVGALAGPFIFLRLFGSQRETLPKIILLGFVLVSSGYAGIGSTNSILMTSLCTIVAHAGGSALWVYSTTLLQMLSEKQTLGRISGVEQMGFFASSTFSQVMIGALVGGEIITAHNATFVLAGIWFCCLVIFTFLFKRYRLV